MIAARGITKSFGATHALRGVDFEVRAGEVHALLGENGAGKSTLMAILSGADRADAGTLTLDGAPFAPKGPRDARRSGVVLVHQELSVCEHMTVEENVVLGDEGSWLVDRKAVRERTKKALAQVGAEAIAPETRVSHLSTAEKQLVEIARAVALPRCRVLLLDEPTSSLAAAEVDRLFALVRKLREAGLAIVYITHFLEDVARVTDRYTVLRDGKVAGSGDVASVTSDDLVRLMSSADVASPPARSPSNALGEELLVVKDVAGVKRPRGASLVLRRGEVLGIAGLVGAGRTELLRCIQALDRVVSGEVKVAGASASSPRERIAQGVGMTSEDRKGEGLALSLSIVDNITLPRMRWRVGGAEREAARAGVERLAIKCNAVTDPVRRLSGGNQQKVALARLLHQKADLLLLDEPTRGIDVGSKAQVHALVRELAASGKSVLVVSSFFPELLAVCDRIAVMHKGVLGEAKPVAAWTEHDLLAAAAGAT